MFFTLFISRIHTRAQIIALLNSAVILCYLSFILNHALIKRCISSKLFCIVNIAHKNLLNVASFLLILHLSSFFPCSLLMLHYYSIYSTLFHRYFTSSSPLCFFRQSIYGNLSLNSYRRLPSIYSTRALISLYSRFSMGHYLASLFSSSSISSIFIHLYYRLCLFFPSSRRVEALPSYYSIMGFRLINVYLQFYCLSFAIPEYYFMLSFSHSMQYRRHSLIILFAIFFLLGILFNDSFTAVLHFFTLISYFPIFIFVVFNMCILVECNRLPFDIPEAESELVAGFMTEFSSLYFSIIILNEYFSLIIFSLFLVLLLNLYISLSLLLLFFYCLTRATLNRLKYDELLLFG